MSPSETPNVKMPTTSRLTGSATSDACSGARTMSMIANSTTSASARLTMPERVAESVKIERGTRTRFISGPFHARPAIAFVVVCAKKFHATYADRKYVS